MQLEVIVKKLNQRSKVPDSLPDPLNIVGVVQEGFRFEGEQVNPELVPPFHTHKWYRDRDKHYYWGGGLRVLDMAPPPVKVAPPVKATPPVKAAPPESVDMLVGVKDWGFIDFKIEEVWQTTKGKDIHVVVMDTGLNFDLDDFKNIPGVTYYDALTDTTIKENCKDNDSKGHGTDCASFLNAQGIKIFGVAPEIKFSVIKISDSSGQRTLPLAIKGMKKVIEWKPDVVSTSFIIARTTQNSAGIDKLHEVVKEAHAKNITIVCAAGNSGGLSDPVDNFPASFPECISVGGITKNRARSKFSTKSNFLDLMGPGENLFSLSRPNTRINGTSFSAPFVAGIIALVKSTAKKQGRTLTNTELFTILENSADKNVQNYNPIDFGWGIVNGPAAIQLL